MNALFIITVLHVFIFIKANEKNIIINLGLPHSGSDLIHAALLKLGISSMVSISPQQLCPVSSFPVHNVTVGGINVPKTFYPNIQKTNCLACVVMQRALAEGLPPLHYFMVSNFTAILQMECLLNDHSNKISIWPFQMLDELYKSYPLAYFIHTRRNSTEHHVKLWTRWHNLLNRLEDHDLLDYFNLKTKVK